MFHKTASRLNKEKSKYLSKGQTAIEYMLLFAVGAMVAFVGFRTLLPQAQEVTNSYFQEAAVGIAGQASPEFPAVFPLECGVESVPRSGAQPTCPQGGYSHELVHWCSGNCSDDDSRTVICCSQELHCVAQPSEDNQNYAVCNTEGAYPKEIVRWCSGNCGEADARVVICCQDDDPDLSLVAIPRDTVGWGGGAYYDCYANNMSPVVTWCSGDCTEDDGWVTMCQAW